MLQGFILYKKQCMRLFEVVLSLSVALDPTMRTPVGEHVKLTYRALLLQIQ